MTCIGNSGPLDENVSAAIEKVWRNVFWLFYGLIWESFKHFKSVLASVKIDLTPEHLTGWSFLYWCIGRSYTVWHLLWLTVLSALSVDTRVNLVSFCILLYAALRLSEMALSCMVVAAAVLSLSDEQLQFAFGRNANRHCDWWALGRTLWTASSCLLSSVIWWCLVLILGWSGRSWGAVGQSELWGAYTPDDKSQLSCLASVGHCLRSGRNSSDWLWKWTNWCVNS